MKHLTDRIIAVCSYLSLRGRLATWAQIAWMPWAVLFTSLGFSVWAAYSVNAAIENAAIIRFEGRADEIRQTIIDRLQDNRQVLLAGAGLFSVNPNISRDDWREYVSRLELEVTRPGILGVGFAKALSDDPASVLAYARQIREQDYKPFQIWPSPRQGMNSTILYLEPLNERNLRAIGFNMLSEASRRKAMLQARDTGLPVSTSYVKLVQENGQQEQLGFLTYLPVYRTGASINTVQARRANLMGWVYSPYRIGDLMTGIFPYGLEDVMFEISSATEGGQPQQLYSSSDGIVPLDDMAHLQQITPLPVGGTNWTLKVSALPNFYAPYTSYYATVVMLGGAIISLLLFWVTMALSSTRSRAITLAHTMSEESRKREQQMREITTAIGEGICVVNDEGLVRFANPQALRLLGRTYEELMGKHVSRFFGSETITHLSFNMLPEGAQSAPLITESEVLHEDKRLPVEVTIAPLFHENRVTGSVFAFRDISSRLLAEKALRESRDFRSLFDYSQDALLLVDTEGHIRDLNQIAADFLGQAGASLVGRRWQEIVVTADHYLFRRALLHTLSAQEGPANRIECHLQQDKANPLPVEMVFSHVNYEGGKHVLIGARDIRQRRREELMERETNHVLEMLLKGLPINQILATLIQAVEHQYSDVVGAVLLADETGELFTEVVAPNLPASYRTMLVQQEICIDSAFGSRPVWNQDLLIHADLERENEQGDCHRLALAHNLRASVAAPLFNAEGMPHGMFVLYYPRPHHPEAQEMHLIQKAARLAELAVERHRFASHIEYLATHDILTALPNRNLMQQTLDQALIRAEHQGTQVAVFFLDLDRFKVINDSLGHDKGDLLLQECAQRLRQIQSGHCTVARLGGDEFVIILEDVAGRQDASRYAQVILQALVQPVSLGEHQLTISTSVGVSLYPDDATDGAMLIKYADVAMYQSKKLGRNRYQFFDLSLNADAYERLLLETELREAVARNQLDIHYQPRVDAASMRYQGLEALVRWHHPRRGLLMPGTFVPLAEEMGLIEDIGIWVLQTACRQVRKWQHAGLEDLKVSVNLSTRQLRDNRIVGLISEVLAQTGLPAQCLEIEITETTLMENIDTALTIMSRLEQLGVTLSVDDFGTGYSSLNYLKKLPIDALKIDRSFVSELPDDKDSMAIVNAIIAMAHNLGLVVVAEGVENEKQMRYLLSHHCSEMQGHFFGKPLPAETIYPLLIENRRTTMPQRVPKIKAQDIQPID